MADEETWAPSAIHFRRKKNDLTAVRLTDENVRSVAKWCGGEAIPDTSSGYVRREGPLLKLPTLNEFPMDAYSGNWVVKDEDGRFSIMENKIFIEEYEVNDQRSKSISFPEEER